jgi:TetR/AcrR family transcriptional regulator, ethionamide resistance regulator
MRSGTDRRAPQRSDFRRDAILDALENCLKEATFEQVSLADIAKEAGVSRSAFYFYFENKAAAVAALMERMVDDTFFVNDVFVLADHAPRDRVRIMLEGLFDTWERHRHMFSAMLQARGRSDVVREIWDRARSGFVGNVAAMISAERAAGVAPDGVDATVLATVLMDLNDRLLERLTLGGSLSRSELVAGATAVWLGTVYGITDGPDESKDAK